MKSAVLEGDRSIQAISLTHALILRKTAYAKAMRERKTDAMKSLKCQATDCIYNTDLRCDAHVILVSNTSEETYCDTYTKENSFVAAGHIADVEFGEEMGDNTPRVSCNVTQCTFNKSFHCRARSIEIDDPHDSVICNCLTFRPK